MTCLGLYYFSLVSLLFALLLGLLGNALSSSGEVGSRYVGPHLLGPEFARGRGLDRRGQEREIHCASAAIDYDRRTMFDPLEVQVNGGFPG